jgi:hypothetical protein
VRSAARRREHCESIKRGFVANDEMISPQLDDARISPPDQLTAYPFT